MLDTMEIVYQSLLWHKPEEREAFVRNALTNVEEEESVDTDSLVTLIGTLDFPKIYNTDIARYGVFVDDATKPLATFKTRCEAWRVAHKKVNSANDRIYVVDIPVSEADDPHYERYWTEYVWTNKKEEEASSETTTISVV
jgi:hypothetical protein